jgi:hypothetical protein
MLRLIADENFNNDIIRGVRRKNSGVDIVRVQDVGLSGADDPAILEWASRSNRVILTHDVSTMTRYAYERVGQGISMPGVFELARPIPIGIAIDAVLILIECSLDGEWEGQVRYLPLR